MTAHIIHLEARQHIAAPKGRGRRALLATMAASCWLVAAYALMLLLVTSMRPPLMQARFERHPIATSLHLALGAVVLAVAPLQLSRRVRQRFRAVHRWSGRVYALSAVVAGFAGLALARVAQGGVPAHVGFAFLSVAWIASTVLGVACLRRGDRGGHARWMTRSVALTFAAVTLRVYIPMAVLLGLPEVPSYQAIAWLCWVPNVAVVEWVMRRRSAGSGTRIV